MLPSGARDWRHARLASANLLGHLVVLPTGFTGADFVVGGLCATATRGLSHDFKPTGIAFLLDNVLPAGTPWATKPYAMMWCTAAASRRLPSPKDCDQTTPG